MRIEKTTVQMRERTQWEAIDLSLVFIKHFARFVYLGWFLLTIPVALLLNFLLQGRGIFPILVFWYLKPLFERLPLFIASRLFFRQSPRLKNFFRRPLHFILRHLSGDLTYRRFSPWRSYAMPVRFLEELQGIKLGKRLKTVIRDGKSMAVTLTVVCLIFELGLFFGWIFLLMVIFMDMDTFGRLLDLFSPMPLWVTSSQFFLYYLSLLIVEPFYTLAGFFLYINRRVYLEGWDIELVFKRLSNRLAGNENPKKPAAAAKRAESSAPALGLLLLLLTVFPCSEAYTQPPDTYREMRRELEKTAETIRQDTKEIMDAPEFRKWEKREWWQWKHKDTTEEKTDTSGTALKKISGLIGKGLAFIAPFLPWLLGSSVFIITALFLIRYRGNRPAGGRARRLKSFLHTKPDGQTTALCILPARLQAAAEEAWRRGEYRSALSLIYRGALVFIIFVRKIFLPESATEGECLIRVREALSTTQPDGSTSAASDSSLLADFAYLLNCWQRTAYAHLQPDDDSFLTLCKRWQPYLAVVDELQPGGEPAGNRPAVKHRPYNPPAGQSGEHAL